MKREITESLKSSLIGGIMCGVISALLSSTILPFPDSLTDHVAGTTVGGFLCGFFAVLLHIIAHALRNKQEINN